MNKLETTFKTNKLSDLKPGIKAIIYKIDGSSSFKKRISELGFIYGSEVKIIKRAPLQDPYEYEILGYRISLRKADAEKIQVIPHRIAKQLPNYKSSNTEPLYQSFTRKANISDKKNLNIALIGNPNTGKTSLFNHASGSKNKVGNYAGVTIDVSTGIYKFKEHSFKIFDLPGIYAITEYSHEELFVRKHLLEEEIDLIINITDASNLARNLYLTMQLADIDIPMVMALNMYDQVERNRWSIDCKKLSDSLGIPVVPTVADKGIGIKNLFETALNYYKNNSTYQRKCVNYGEVIEKSIQKISKKLIETANLFNKNYFRFISICLLEGDDKLINQIQINEIYKNISKIVQYEKDHIETALNEELNIDLIHRRYAFIQELVSQNIKKPDNSVLENRDIDKFLTHPIWGIVSFIAIIWLSFKATFSIGGYPMDWIDSRIGLLSDWISNSLQTGPLKDLIIDGILGGIGGVIIFLPNILILFGCLSLMEDSGYMARAAFIMDKLMSKLGLHGKAFIPLIMGFGCNVPAIMATRTVENKKDRLKTMFMIPFMSCSARLPVYVLLIAAFFNQYQASILLAIYGIGILLAIGIGVFFNLSNIEVNKVPFIMELPPYRLPTLKNTLIHMGQKATQYLKKMGTTILFSSIIIWALGYFPQHIEYKKDYNDLMTKTQSNNTLTDEDKRNIIEDLELSRAEEHLERSYIGQLGHFISPVLYPLGFDWKMGVSIITGMAAKEIVVSSMGILYQADLEADETSASLIEKLKNRRYEKGPKSGQKIFTPLTAFSFMVFILLYFPCIAVIAALIKEAGWLRAIATAIFSTLAAWFISLYIYQIGSYIIG